MIAQGWLSQKKFEAVCQRVCARQLTVAEALSRFCPPGWRRGSGLASNLARTQPT